MNSFISKSILKITLRMFIRDKRKLILAFLSLFIGSFVLTTVLGITGSIKSFLNEKSKELVGGDLVIQRPYQIDPKNENIKSLIKQSSDYTNKMGTLITFSTPSSNFSVLSSAKVISDNYPLYGKIKTKNNQITIPQENEIYAEQNLLDRLSLKIGNKVYIGDTDFIVKDILLGEPDRISSGFSFGPTVLMSFKGWERTNIDKTQSRISYSVSFKLPIESLASESNKKIIKGLRDDGARVYTSVEGPTQLFNVLDTSKKFFLTVIVLSLFLVIVNIRVSFTYLLNYFTKTIAIFRSLGMKKESVVVIFTVLITTISLFSSVFGNLFGNLSTYFVLPYMKQFFGNQPLPLPPFFENIILVTVFTIGLCLLSALSTLTKIIQIKPKLLLSEDFSGDSSLKKSQEFMAIILLIIGIYLGVYFLSQSFKVTNITTLSIVGVFSFFVLISKLLISVLYKYRFKFSFYFRSIFSFIHNQGLVGVTAISSLTLALTSIFTILLVQSNISANLKSTVKEKTPNMYVLDIQDDQLNNIDSYFKGDLKYFSNIRARFMRVDNKDMQKDNSPELSEFKREFNLTYRTELISGEKVVAGTWHGEGKKNEVSLEDKFAERAGIKIGSEVEFLVQGIPIIAKVTSLRSVDSSQGLPFFYMVFTPNLLEEAPKSFFGYTYIDEKRIPRIQNELAKGFPNISVIPTSEIIKTVQNVTNLILGSVFSVSIPALVLGLILIFSMITNTSIQRFRDLLIFKIFGFNKKGIFKIYFYENLFFILFATTFSVIFANIASFYINKFVFKFTSYFFNYSVFGVVLIVLFFAIIFSLILLRKMFRLKPSVLFRD